MNNPETPAGQDWDVLAGQPIDARRRRDPEPGRDACSPRSTRSRTIWWTGCSSRSAWMRCRSSWPCCSSARTTLTNRADPTSSVESLTFSSGQPDHHGHHQRGRPGPGTDRRVDGAGRRRLVELHQGAGRSRRADADGRFVFDDVSTG